MSVATEKQVILSTYDNEMEKNCNYIHEFSSSI